MPKKRGRGRPPVRKRPEPINASPEEVARVVLNTPPPQKWRYMGEEEKRKDD